MQALSMCAHEIVAVRNQLAELGVQMGRPTILLARGVQPKPGQTACPFGAGWRAGWLALPKRWCGLCFGLLR